MPNKLLTISELSSHCGLSSHTLRFYERSKILQPISRASSGHRRYCEQDIRWLEFVMRLKSTGMPLAQIKQYAELRSRGDATLQARLRMLEMHQEKLHEEISKLTNSSNALMQKIRLYKQQIKKSGSSNRRA